MRSIPQLMAIRRATTVVTPLMAIHPCWLGRLYSDLDMAGMVTDGGIMAGDIERCGNAAHV